eukprot:1930491-Amphidinium_carterae.1
MRYPIPHVSVWIARDQQSVWSAKLNQVGPPLHEESLKAESIPNSPLPKPNHHKPPGNESGLSGSRGRGCSTVKQRSNRSLQIATIVTNLTLVR